MGSLSLSERLKGALWDARLRVVLAWAVLRGKPVIHGLMVRDNNVAFSEGTVLGAVTLSSVNIQTDGCGFRYKSNGTVVVEYLDHEVPDLQDEEM